MNIITQTFRHSVDQQNKLNEDLKNLFALGVSKVYLFSDVRIRNLDPRIVVIRRDSRLKWNDVFEFIKDNQFLNKEGVFILEPFERTNLGFSKDGIHVFEKAVYVKNITKSYPIKRFIFNDYEFLRLNITGEKFRVASICHIYYEDLLEEVIQKQLGLKESNFEIDYYFSLTNDSSTVGQKEWVKKKLLENFPQCMILNLPNKGLDVGPFLKSIEHIYTQNKNYDYIIKTHTKKSLKTSGSYFGNMWRRTLLEILNPDKFSKIEQMMGSGDLMICSRRWIINTAGDQMNKTLVNEIRNELDIKYGDEFVGGTMFIMKFSLIKKYFPIERLRKYYDRLEEGYFYQISRADQEYFTHALERVFGLIIGNEKKRIQGI